MKNRHFNALLMEVLIAIFFFALSSTVIVQMFVAARVEADRSAQLNRAICAAQNFADRLSLHEGEMTSEKLSDGTVLFVTSEVEPTETGVLHRRTVVVMTADGTELLRLPCTEYEASREVAP